MTRTAFLLLISILPAAAAAAQDVPRDTTFAIQLMTVDSTCVDPADCIAPVVHEGDASLVFSSPGDRYLIGLENRSSKAMYMSLLVMTGTAPEGQIAWPQLVQPGQTAVLPDTLLIDARLGTDLLIVLAHDRYFSPLGFRRIEPDKYRTNAGWDLKPLFEMLTKNESRVHIARLYYHITRGRTQ